MPKRYKEVIREHGHWLLAVVCSNAFFILFLWIADIRKFAALAVSILLLSVCLCLIAFAYEVVRDRKRERILDGLLLAAPDTGNVADVDIDDAADIDNLSAGQRRLLVSVRETVEKVEEELNKQKTGLSDYEAYIEAWTHEIKTPLSLMTLVLDNRKDAMPEGVNRKLQYALQMTEGYVEQIIYYAKVQSPYRDYSLEGFDLSTLIGEELELYKELLVERRTALACDIGDIRVTTDRRGFGFILGQILNNALKYAGKEISERSIALRSETEADGISLYITNTGTGVRPSDLPFIFQKGFVGDDSDKGRHSTGMGLYLAAEVAGHLGLKLFAASEFGRNFTMRIWFPI